MTDKQLYAEYIIRDILYVLFLGFMIGAFSILSALTIVGFLIYGWLGVVILVMCTLMASRALYMWVLDI